MAYGTDFDSATLINMSNVITGDLQTGDPDHYFRVVPKANTDYIYAYIPDRREKLYLYDSTRTLISSTTTQGNAVTAIPVDQQEYFIRVGVQTAGTYTMYVFASVDGVIDGYTSIVGETQQGDTSERVYTITPWLTVGEKNKPITTDDQSSIDTYEIEFGKQFKPTHDYFNIIIPTIQARAYNSPVVSQNNVHYRIKGTVKREGSAAGGKTLRLYDRDSGVLIGETQSEQTGKYQFDTQLKKDSKYYVIAFDDMNAPDMQAVIHDALVPIEIIGQQ